MKTKSKRTGGQILGIVFYMMSKNSKRKDTGMILLGFATLMFGMETMSGAVAPLREVPAFQQLFLTFANPLLGVLAGAVLTAIIQSSSASVGILQALASTGAVTYGAAIPIIMAPALRRCSPLSARAGMPAEPLSFISASISSAPRYGWQCSAL